jgi:hypothetical protein
VSSAGRAGGYFSDGLLNCFHFDKDLTARRKNPARGLRGERVISHSLQNLVLGGDNPFSQSRTWEHCRYIRIATYLDQGLKLLQLHQNITASPSILTVLEIVGFLYLSQLIPSLSLCYSFATLVLLFLCNIRNDLFLLQTR